LSPGKKIRKREGKKNKKERRKRNKSSRGFFFGSRKQGAI
jgi:hypothetical protein